MATLVEMLRKKNDEEAALSGLKSKAEYWQGQQQNIQPATVQTPGNYGGAPAPTPVNYGGILQNAVSTFMGARSQKKYEEAKARNEAASQQFMMDTLKNDPEAQRLAVMAQYGVPGAEKALSERIAPQKEKLVNLQQNAKTLPRNMTKEVAEEYAKLYNVSPEMVISISDGYWKGVDDEANLKQKNAIELQGIKDSAAAARTGARNAATLQAANIRKGNGKSGVGATGAGGAGDFVLKEDGTKDYTPYLTAGERQILSKAKLEADKAATQSTGQMAAYQNLRNEIQSTLDSAPKQFGQAVASGLADSGIPIISQGAEYFKNDATKQLESYIKSDALVSMAALGGSDSNEELRKMMADLPKMYNDPKVLQKMLTRMDNIQQVANYVNQMKARDATTGALIKETHDYAAEAWKRIKGKNSGVGGGTDKGAGAGQYNLPEGFSVEVN